MKESLIMIVGEPFDVRIRRLEWWLRHLHENRPKPPKRGRRAR
jgi:hypothetical protein